MNIIESHIANLPFRQHRSRLIFASDRWRTLGKGIVILLSTGKAMCAACVGWLIYKRGFSQTISKLLLTSIAAAIGPALQSVGLARETADKISIIK